MTKTMKYKDTTNQKKKTKRQRKISDLSYKIQAWSVFDSGESKSVANKCALTRVEGKNDFEGKIGFHARAGEGSDKNKIEEKII